MSSDAILVGSTNSRNHSPKTPDLCYKGGNSPCKLLAHCRVQLQSPVFDYGE